MSKKNKGFVTASMKSSHKNFHFENEMFCCDDSGCCIAAKMKTKVSVISTFTTIQGSGQVEFDCDVGTTTVGVVKELVENVAQVKAEKQSIWWRGYILDDDTLTLLQACRGVDEGESIDVGADSLVIFMTEPIEKKRPLAYAS